MLESALELSKVLYIGHLKRTGVTVSIDIFYTRLVFGETGRRLISGLSLSLEREVTMERFCWRAIYMP